MIHFILITVMMIGTAFTFCSNAAARGLSCKNFFTRTAQLAQGPLYSSANLGFSKTETEKALYEGILKLGSLAQGCYIPAAKALAPYIVRKLLKGYDQPTPLNQFIRNLLTDLIYNPNWSKTKAQVTFQALEYLSLHNSGLRMTEGTMALHIITRTILIGTTHSQKALLQRLDAINEGQLHYYDFDDL